MRAIFGQIANIEPHSLPFIHVFDGEIVPGDVPAGVGVDPQEEVVFVMVYLYRAVQISALKSGLKHQLFLQVDGGVHAFKGAIVELIPVELIMRHYVLDTGEGTLR